MLFVFGYYKSINQSIQTVGLSTTAIFIVFTSYLFGNFRHDISRNIQSLVVFSAIPKCTTLLVLHLFRLLLHIAWPWMTLNNEFWLPCRCEISHALFTDAGVA